MLSQSKTAARGSRDSLTQLRKGDLRLTAGANRRIPPARIETTAGSERSRSRHLRRLASNVRRQTESIHFPVELVFRTAALSAQ